MSEITDLFEAAFRPLEEVVREYIENAIESKDKQTLWALKEIAEGRKP
ncbi:hypothetical protein LCGC14_1205780 [marine sediment metagenome]|uniref:Uncharacterized protein n=1 Tax=marine sediment metagenome TaxID=412755 RepID=A0A0F9PK84_9ZZZZ